MREWTMQRIIAKQKQEAECTGRAWWFGKGEMQFFDSRVEAGPFHNPAAHPTKHYFVSSEQCHFGDGTSAPRLYSVRVWDEERPVEVRTEGRFQQFKTLEHATKVATALGFTGTVPTELAEEDDA